MSDPIVEYNISIPEHSILQFIAAFSYFVQYLFWLNYARKYPLVLEKVIIVKAIGLFLIAKTLSKLLLGATILFYNYFNNTMLTILIIPSIVFELYNINFKYILFYMLSV
jgi:hypothetical protein